MLDYHGCIVEQWLYIIHHFEFHMHTCLTLENHTCMYMYMATPIIIATTLLEWCSACLITFNCNAVSKLLFFTAFSISQFHCTAALDHGACDLCYTYTCAHTHTITSHVHVHVTHVNTTCILHVHQFHGNNNIHT